MTSQNITIARNTIALLSNAMDILQNCGIDVRWGMTHLNEAIMEFQTSLDDVEYWDLIKAQKAYENQTALWLVEDQENFFEFMMDELEDEFRLLVAEDACEGISDRHGDVRLAKEMMDRTISPRVWMRSGNSRISKCGKKNFKRLHRERMEMAL